MSKGMLGFGKTETIGAGSITGRGFGPCGLGLVWLRRFGARRGVGRYFGCCSFPQVKENKLKALAYYKKALQEELRDVEKEENEASKSE